MSRYMHLNLMLGFAGAHEEGWHVDAGGNVTSVNEYYVRMAQLAERGLFDSVFFASSLSLYMHAGKQPMPVLDPVPLIAYIAACTTHIGLAATISTTFTEPYIVAQTMSTLDHLSGGRVGWNIVTSADPSSARNFGMSVMPPKAERYARALEFVEVVEQLWANWKPGSMYPTKGGAAADPSHIPPIDFHGRYFNVAGPGGVPATPQGRPILFQAGASNDGTDFSSRVADGVFCVGLNIEDTRAFCNQLKEKVALAKRNPDDVKILPGVHLYVGNTDEEAKRIALEEGFQEGLLGLGHLLGIDARTLDITRPVPDEILEQAMKNPSSQGHTLPAVNAFRRDPTMTVEEYVMQHPTSSPHRVLWGSPEKIAASLEEWFTAGAGDGFTVTNLRVPSLTLFVEHVVPVLQRKGLFRKEYAGRTLRENLMQTADGGR